MLKEKKNENEKKKKFKTLVLIANSKNKIMKLIVLLAPITQIFWFFVIQSKTTDMPWQCEGLGHWWDNDIDNGIMFEVMNCNFFYSQ